MPDPIIPPTPQLDMKPFTKEGYVWQYSLFLIDPTKNKVYFRVTISSSADQLEDAKTFVLIRNMTSESVDQDANQKPWAITHSAVSMAIIATLKDALISGKKVKIDYYLTKPPTPEPALFNVTIVKG